ncbi:extracellular solute-binding protein [Cohnella thermotolerans]|uniref:extracellular solute-binding protein n=1 Tax=Cohnella thermotolerans TaxID=329858 RepID=UPI0003FEC8B9|nr:extracellular solute-binding protein [Cohnella thermotolerans]
MNIRLWQKACALVPAAALIFVIPSQLGFSESGGPADTGGDAAAGSVRQAQAAVAPSETSIHRDPSYADKKLEWQAKGIAGARQTVSVDAGQPHRVSDAAKLTIGDYAGKSGVLLWRSSNENWVEYEASVPESALYEIDVSYEPIAGEGTGPILWDVSIDGERQFEESSSTALYRLWKDDRPILKNADGDQIRPRSEEVSDWSVKPLLDAAGGYSEPLQWYFTQGKHVIRFSGNEPVALERFDLAPSKPVASYAEVSAGYPEQTPEAQRSQGKAQTIQAEDFTYKNDTAIKLFSDRDPRSVPRAKGRITYNTVGGTRWVEQNQEITWTFEVPADGEYKFAFRMLQNLVSQKTSFRTIRIDGRVPFREFEAYAFPYTASWKGKVIADGDGKPYLVYLTKGTHQISLAVTHAPVQPVLEGIQHLSDDLDSVNWDLRGLVGAVIDRNRTWVPERDYPELPGKLQELAERMDRLADDSVRINGGSDAVSQALKAGAKDIRTILKKPEDIPYNTDEITAIREKLNVSADSLLDQALQLDELYIAPKDAKFPSMKASIWNRVTGSLQNFAYSFNSRDSIAKTDDTKLNVWVRRGRDYVDQLQQLADEEFTPATGIQVKVNLIANQELLLLSNAAGVQPDLALGLTQDMPVDLAIRGSLQDLSEMSGFDDTYKRFSPGSWLPLYYDGGYYALPETQSFQVLFYRQDILDRLGLKVPQTWDDVYAMLPTLQQNAMNFYVDPTQFSQYFYNNNVEFYDQDGLKTALDTPAAFSAFKRWTDLFTTYAVEQQVPSFYEHFRDGTMPIGISDYNTYVQLAAAAPELNGRWGIAVIPGVRQADGTVTHWAGGGQQTDVMFKRSNKKDEAWRFLQWWTSADVQQAFGEDLEAINGVAFRWNTANVEAFSRLPWKKEDARVILEQWRWYKDIPNVPGGYFLTRELNNAWNRTVVSKVNYRASLEQANRDINRELRRKQQEFGFVDAGGNRLKRLDIPVIRKPWEGIDPYVE